MKILDDLGQFKKIKEDLEIREDSKRLRMIQESFWKDSRIF